MGRRQLDPVQQAALERARKRHLPVPSDSDIQTSQSHTDAASLTVTSHATASDDGRLPTRQRTPAATQPFQSQSQSQAQQAAQPTEQSFATYQLARMGFSMIAPLIISQAIKYFSPFGSSPWGNHAVTFIAFIAFDKLMSKVLGPSATPTQKQADGLEKLTAMRATPAKEQVSDEEAWANAVRSQCATFSN